MTEYVGKIEAVDLKDSVAFCALLNEGVTLLSLSDEDVAREFGVSKPTIQRWKSGLSTPHPIMRAPLYRWLINKCKELDALG